MVPRSPLNINISEGLIRRHRRAQRLKTQDVARAISLFAYPYGSLSLQQPTFFFLLLFFV